MTSSPLLLSLALINPAVFRSGSALVTFKPPMALRSFRNPNPVSSLLKYPVLPCSTPRLLSSNRLRFPIQTAAFRTTTTAKMSLDEWKHRAPYKIHENDANFKVRYEGGCHCGRVRYQLSREKPLDAKYCHCTTCQKLHGTFLWSCSCETRSTWLIGDYRCTVPMGCNFSQGRHQFHQGSRWTWMVWQHGEDNKAQVTVQSQLRLLSDPHHGWG